MFDTIIFRHNDDYFVDCDAKFASHLVKHLKMYKVRRQVTIVEVILIVCWLI